MFIIQARVLNKFKGLQKSETCTSQAIASFDIPEECNGMYVYAIRNNDTGNIKLGISRDPHKRLKQLQTGCDGALIIIAMKLAENGYKDESYNHFINQRHHIYGEWFNNECDLTNFNTITDKSH